MKIEFIENIPKYHSESPILISGESSLEFNNKQFLSVTKEDGKIDIYEIRYEYHCSPFKQAEVMNNILVVGHEVLNLNEKTITKRIGKVINRGVEFYFVSYFQTAMSKS